MEIKIKTKTVLIILLIILWIIFVGLCIEAGGFLTNAFFALFNPELVPRLWHPLDLSALFKIDTDSYFVLSLIMAIIAAMKAWLFYMIIKVLHNRNLNFTSPFNIAVRNFLFILSYIALVIGFFSNGGVKYMAWLSDQGVTLTDTQYLKIGGGDVWLFMAIILFVIALIFKRGIEIQTENDLTI